MAKNSEYGDSRSVINIYDTPFKPYDMEGPLQENMSYLPLTLNKDGNNQGVYVIRMEPGAETVAHTHRWNEDYLILEGDLIEPDGKILGPGDFVHYDQGTYHNSRTETGCFLIGCDWGRDTTGK